MMTHRFAAALLFCLARPAGAQLAVTLSGAGASPAAGTAGASVSGWTEGLRGGVPEAAGARLDLSRPGHSAAVIRHVLARHPAAFQALASRPAFIDEIADGRFTGFPALAFGLQGVRSLVRKTVAEALALTEEAPAERAEALRRDLDFVLASFAEKDLRYFADEPSVIERARARAAAVSGERLMASGRRQATALGPAVEPGPVRDGATAAVVEARSENKALVRLTRERDASLDAAIGSARERIRILLSRSDLTPERIAALKRARGRGVSVQAVGEGSEETATEIKALNRIGANRPRLGSEAGFISDTANLALGAILGLLGLAVVLPTLEAMLPGFYMASIAFVAGFTGLGTLHSLLQDKRIIRKYAPDEPKYGERVEDLANVALLGPFLAMVLSYASFLANSALLKWVGIDALSRLPAWAVGGWPVWLTLASAFLLGRVFAPSVFGRAGK